MGSGGTCSKTLSGRSEQIAIGLRNGQPLNNLAMQQGRDLGGRHNNRVQATWYPPRLTRSGGRRRACPRPKEGIHYAVSQMQARESIHGPEM